MFVFVVIVDVFCNGNQLPGYFSFVPILDQRQSIVDYRFFFIKFSNPTKWTEARNAFSFLFSSEKEFLYMNIYENYLN